MNQLPKLLANLEYPSGPVMGFWFMVCIGFIVGGGFWFKHLEGRNRAEREARKSAAEATPTKNP